MAFREFRSPSPNRDEAAHERLAPRWAPLGWDPGRMTDHRQASPGRKLDLNPVEWDRPAAAISGHFGPGGADGSFPC